MFKGASETPNRISNQFYKVETSYLIAINILQINSYHLVLQSASEVWFDLASNFHKMIFRRRQTYGYIRHHLYIKPDVTLPCGLLKSFPRLAVISFLDRFFQSFNSNLINYPRSCAETKWPWVTFRLKIYSVFCICLQRSVCACRPNSQVDHWIIVTTR